jgi:hypothetical protein
MNGLEGPREARELHYFWTASEDGKVLHHHANMLVDLMLGLDIAARPETFTPGFRSSREA